MSAGDGVQHPGVAAQGFLNGGLQILDQHDGGTHIHLADGQTILAGGEAAAAQCAQVLAERDMLASPDNTGGCRCYVSDQPHNFTRVAEMFLGRAVSEDVCQVNLEGEG